MLFGRLQGVEGWNASAANEHTIRHSGIKILKLAQHIRAAKPIDHARVHRAKIDPPKRHDLQVNGFPMGNGGINQPARIRCNECNSLCAKRFENTLNGLCCRDDRVTAFCLGSLNDLGLTIPSNQIS